MIDRRDSDPGIHPDDLLWDPKSASWVPRHSIIGPVFWAVVGAVFASLVWAAATNGSGSTPAAPEPSFVAVPTTPSETERSPSDCKVIGASERAKVLSVPVLATPPPGGLRRASPECNSVPSAPAVVATPTPRPTVGPTPTLQPFVWRHVETGVATWYDDPRKTGTYAAAGPPLRVGNWRGRLVWVSTGGHAFPVILSDWCACREKVIDLSPGLFSRFAPLDRGIVIVTVRW